FSSPGRLACRPRFPFTWQSRSVFVSGTVETGCNPERSECGPGCYCQRSGATLSRLEHGPANLRKIVARVRRRRISTSALPLARCCRLCLADCVRECGEPATGARTHSGERTGGPRCARGEPMAFGAAG